MASLEDCITPSPMDEPDVFCKKLNHLSEATLQNYIPQFLKLKDMVAAFFAHLTLLKRAEMNVKLTYTHQNGWHLSSCDKSLIIVNEPYIICTCEKDIRDLNAFFEKVRREYLIRCKNCRRKMPDWEEIQRVEQLECKKKTDDLDDLEK